MNVRGDFIFGYIQQHLQTLNCSSTLYQSRGANDIGIQPSPQFLELLKQAFELMVEFHISMSAKITLLKKAVEVYPESIPCGWRSVKDKSFIAFMGIVLIGDPTAKDTLQ